MSSHRPTNAISTLNEAQRRTLRITCEYIDKLLKGMEDVLNETRSNSVFPKYIDDILPLQRQVIKGYLSRIRAQLLRVLAGQAIESGEPQIAASHAIHTNLTFTEIAIEELSPSRMCAYGPISEAGAADLNAIMQELQSLVGQLHGCVLQRGGPDLKNRKERIG